MPATTEHGTRYAPMSGIRASLPTDTQGFMDALDGTVTRQP